MMGSSGRQARWRHADHEHLSATVRAAKLRFVFSAFHRQMHAQHPLHDFENAFGIAMQESEIACAAQAFGQDVLQEQRHEVLTGQGASLPGLSFAVAISEGDVLAIVCNEVAIANDAAIQIA